jgi:RNA-binding protein
MELTSKQRKKLRSMANTLDTTLIIGKDNVNPGVVAQADEALEARELVKCSVLETSELTAREACDQLCEYTGAQGVQVIGRKFVIYRQTHRKDVKSIELD